MEVNEAPTFDAKTYQQKWEAFFGPKKFKTLREVLRP